MTEDANGAGQMQIVYVGEDELSIRQNILDAEGKLIFELDMRKVAHLPNDWKGLRQEISGREGAEFWPKLESRQKICAEVLRVIAQEKGIEASKNYAKNPEEDVYSNRWYAQRILPKCEDVMKTRLSGEVLSERILLSIMEIGSWYTEWEWRSSLKAHIVRGDGTLKSAASGAAARRNQKAPDTQKRLSKMSELVAKGHTVQSAAEAVHRHGIGLSAAANRQLWIRHKGKKV